MMNAVLPIKNFYWAGDFFRPSIEAAPGWLPTLGTLRGQFALASFGDDKITLTRDPLGLNKLFFAIHRSGRVSVANYLIDLIRLGVPCGSVYSVPAGHVVQIDLRHRTLVLSRYFTPQVDTTLTQASVDEVAGAIRRHLEVWFTRLAKEFNSRKVFMALSGGVDSGLIAMFAKKYFGTLTAYTYTYTQAPNTLSEDAAHARQLADFLDIPFRLVPASEDDVLGAVENALVYGQDWRDFNVHCAIVNELLGRAMDQDLRHGGRDSAALVLTGDLMNEFVADYTPLVYADREYYPLPKVDRGPLRLALVRGLDAGDREVGIYGRHGLDVIQPYGLVVDHVLKVPTALVLDEGSKQVLARAIAGHSLPDWIFQRPKVRAQIGSSREVRGILPVLLESGRDRRWLRDAFRDLFGITDDVFLNEFIWAGVYRFINEFPTRIGENGYLIR